MMKILVLTDGGKNVGFGHLARCLSLCQAFEMRRFEPEFFVNGDDSIKSILREKKFKVLNWMKAEEKLRQPLKEADVVIIDSYLAGETVYRNISDLARFPVYLDDNCRIDYPPGIVINWNIYAPDLAYPVKDGVTYLLGPQYISLRKAFWNVPKKKTRREVNRVMVTFGGDDSKNVTPKVLSFLTREYPLLRKDVIIGNAFKNVRAIKETADSNTRFFHSLDDKGMKAIMMESDVAVSSGGQTLFELARTGVPTVAAAVAENQQNNVNGWGKKGFIESAGFWRDKNLMDNVAAAFHRFLDYRRRLQSTETGQQLVPANGADRVLDFIQSKINN
jgi:UDP-2,4-diacetamido-2,4,6-trideoxy-beta-L-altropyranose hydrolase